MLKENRMGIAQGLSHVVIHVSDMDRSKVFYKTLFDWEEMFDMAFEGEGIDSVTSREQAYCRSVGGSIGYLRLELVQTNWDCNPVAKDALGLTVLTFQVSDADEAYAECCRLGLEPESPPSELLGCRIFFIFDPDGQKLEIVQYLAHTEAWGGEGPHPLLAR